MTEPSSNIIGIHKDCAKERKINFQKNFDRYSIKVGDFVKKEFKENGKSEHMWVKIVSLSEKGIKGTLDNDPLFLENIKYGDSVCLKLNEIEQHIKI